MKKVFFAVLILFIFFKPLTIVIDNASHFFARDYDKRYEQLKNAYNSSQYVQKKNPTIIPDETFEQYAAGAFLNGLNPILIVHDHPPLGRYILSFSILLFNNPATIVIPLYILSLFGIYLIARMVFKNFLFSLIPIALFSNEPLMFNKLQYAPLPEIIQFPFIVFSFYFFFKYIEGKSIAWAIATALSLGFVISTRLFVTGGLMMVVMILSMFLLRIQLKKIIFFLSSLPLSVVILWASYTVSITQAGNFLAPLGIQKYILSYHQSKFILPFSFWDLILFNRWHTWWGEWEVIRDSSWVFLWPVSIVLSVVYFVLSVFKKVNLQKEEKVLFLWLLAYSLLLSTGYTSTRYFMPIIPFLYILSFSFIIKIILRKNEK